MKLMERADKAAQYRYLFLFLILLGELLLLPYAGENDMRYHWFRAFGLALTVLSVYAVSFRKSTLVAALILAIPAVLSRVILSKQDASALSLVTVMLTFGFDVFVLITIFRRIFRFELVTSSTIYGALCIYLLIGFSFSNLYMFLDKINPRSFYLVPGVNLHSTMQYSDITYYSFGSMTSLGASGIVPVTDQVRSLSVVEAILGLLYLAVLVSRLVGMYQLRLSEHSSAAASTTTDQ
jgi:hypothetical protein